MGLISSLNREHLKALLVDRQFRLKARNFILNNIERTRKSKMVKSFPYSATLNTTNMCNLRCRFCELHYFYKKAKESAGRVFPNHLDTDILKNSDEWLRYAISVELSGASGEPFVNPNIIEVIHWLKKHNIRISATTNGLLIDEEIAQELIRAKFDSLLFSIHAGDSELYAQLQGGDFDQVLSNMKYIAALKREGNCTYPRIYVNFMLNQMTAHSVKDLMKLVKGIGVDAFVMNHYYDSRNALNKDISFYFDVERCNELLKDAYSYAKEIGLTTLPAQPPYLASMGEGDIDDNPGGSCQAPWTTIKFKGCVEHENCEYLGVCNRILLFRLDYKEFYEDGRNSFHKDIWNSKLLQFFRETVNSKESNPVCRFCRNPDTARIRCIDNLEYSRLRDQVIKDFFTEFRSRYEAKPVRGLIPLEEHPYKYDEKDGF